MIFALPYVQKIGLSGQQQRDFQEALNAYITSITVIPLVSAVSRSRCCLEEKMSGDGCVWKLLMPLRKARVSRF